jgi:hypothetical protein
MTDREVLLDLFAATVTNLRHDTSDTSHTLARVLDRTRRHIDRTNRERATTKVPLADTGSC